MADISLREYLGRLDELLNRGASDEVIHHCRQILQYFPQNVATYRSLGRAVLDSARWQEAGEIFRRVLGVFPDDYIAHLGLGEVYQKTNEIDSAIWHLERAFELDPNNEALISEIQELYRQHRRVELEKLQLTTGAVARQYIRNGLYEQAMSSLEQALAQSPDRFDLRLLLAQTLWDSGQDIEAAETAADILRSLPNCLEANRILTEVWLGAERPSDAQRHLNRIEAVDPYAALEIAQGQPVPDDIFRLEELDYRHIEQRRQAVNSPDWLRDIGELSEADIEGATSSPRSGENFGDWMGAAAAGSSTFAEDDGFDLGTQDEAFSTALPDDWLTSDNLPAAADEGDMPDFFSSLEEQGEEEPREHTGFTGMLAALNEPEAEGVILEETEDEGVSDIFGDLTSDGTFSDSTIKTSAEVMPDWLRDAAPPQAQPQQPAKQPGTGDIETPDPLAWLQGSGIEIVEDSGAVMDTTGDLFGADEEMSYQDAAAANPMAWLQGYGGEVLEEDAEAPSPIPTGPMADDFSPADESPLAWMESSGVELADTPSEEGDLQPDSSLFESTSEPDTSLNWLQDESALEEALSMEELAETDSGPLPPLEEDSLSTVFDHLDIQSSTWRGVTDVLPQSDDAEPEEFSVLDWEGSAAQAEEAEEVQADEEALEQAVALFPTDSEISASLFDEQTVEEVSDQDEDEEFAWMNEAQEAVEFDLAETEMPEFVEADEADEPAAVASEIIEEDADFDWASELDQTDEAALFIATDDAPPTAMQTGDVPDLFEGDNLEWLGSLEVSDGEDLSDAAASELDAFSAQFEQPAETEEAQDEELIATGIDTPEDTFDLFETELEPMSEEDQAAAYVFAAEDEAETEFDDTGWAGETEKDIQVEALLTDADADEMLETDSFADDNLEWLNNLDETLAEEFDIATDQAEFTEDLEEEIPESGSMFIVGEREQPKVDISAEEPDDLFAVSPVGEQGVSSMEGDMPDNQDDFSWMADFGNDDEEQSGDVPDWLSSAAPSEESTDSESEADEFDWLDNIQAEDEVAPQASANEIPDWLSSAAPTEDEEEAAGAVENPFGWMSEYETEIESSAEEEDVQDELAWMNELGGEEEEEETPEPVSDGIPDWLSSAAPPTSEAEELFETGAEEDELARMSELGGEEEEEETPEPVSDGIPDWLSSAAPPTSEAEELFETGAEEDELAWMSDQQTDEEMEEEFPVTADVPDWLSSVVPATADSETFIDDEDQDEFAWTSDDAAEESVGASSSAFTFDDEDAAEAQGEEFGWISELQSASPEDEEPFAASGDTSDWATEAATLSQAEEAAEASALDWMSDFEIGDDEEPEEEFATSDDTPDWLSEFSPTEEEAEFQAGDEDEWAEETDQELAANEWFSEIGTSQQEQDEFFEDEAVATESEFGWLDEIEQPAEQPTTAQAGDLSWMEDDNPDEPDSVVYTPIFADTAEENALQSNYFEEGEEKVLAAASTPPAAENAPDWLNAMVPGLDLDYDAPEDQPMEQEYIQGQSHRRVQTSIRERGAATSTQEFDWLTNIVDEEQQHPGEPAPVAMAAQPPERRRFTFSRQPAWLQESAQWRDEPTTSIKDDEDLPEWLRDSEELFKDDAEDKTDDFDLPDWL